MRIHLSAGTRPATALANDLLQDRRISFTARGILCYLLSLPDGAQEDVRTLADDHPRLGRTAVSAAVDELIAHGYYVRHLFRNEDTGQVRTGTAVFDVPQTAERPVPASPGDGGAVDGSTGAFPKGVKTPGEKPTHPPSVARLFAALPERSSGQARRVGSAGPRPIDPADHVGPVDSEDFEESTDADEPPGPGAPPGPGGGPGCGGTPSPGLLRRSVESVRRGSGHPGAERASSAEPARPAGFRRRPAATAPGKAGRPAEPGAPADAAEAVASPLAAQAFALLERLVEAEPRLALSAADTLALVPLAVPWIADGVPERDARYLLTGGLPVPVHSARALLANRLVRKLPAPRTQPADTPAAALAECGSCCDPLPRGQATGICAACSGAARPSQPPPMAAETLAERVAALRALMRRGPAGAPACG